MYERSPDDVRCTSATCSKCGDVRQERVKVANDVVVQLSNAEESQQRIIFVDMGAIACIDNERGLGQCQKQCRVPLE